MCHRSCARASLQKTQVCSDLHLMKITCCSEHSMTCRHARQKASRGHIAYLDLMCQNLRILGHDQVDVAQRHILDLWLCAQQRHQRRRHLFVQCLFQCLIIYNLHLLQNHLHHTQQSAPRRDSHEAVHSLLAVWSSTPYGFVLWLDVCNSNARR